MNTTNNPFMALPTKPDWLDECPATSANSPLNGLRLAVKDLFHIAGLPTSAGNPDWLKSHPIPQQTAPAVTRLLNNGAQFVGKTITDEIAYSLNGQNIHYGTPINPKAPTRLPGGSSSGSAVAVSMGLADIGLGTDTGGSIRVPASYQGLFGLRPTHGLISTDNMVPLAPSFDTVGALTRDLATLSKVMDCLLPDSSSHTLLPLCVVDNLIDEAAHATALREMLGQWQQNSALEFASPIEIDTQKWQLNDTFRILQGAEIWQQHGHWIRTSRPHIAVDIDQRLQGCASYTYQQIQTAQDQRTAFVHWFSALVGERILVLPTTPGISPLIATPANELADYRNRLLSLTALAGLSGCPQLHLPTHLLHHAPCGVSLIGPKGSDKLLLRTAEYLGTANQ
ncbi:amidase [Alteromonas sp. 14N.309.X.WAT.G.H12]|uniref:amidase n=1 Tax=Alteromonas sp. 14N.309.X.WAT.G.H12 TaxID=3120824 RepID=UPI002FD03177